MPYALTIENTHIELLENLTTLPKPILMGVRTYLLELFLHLDQSAIMHLENRKGEDTPVADTVAADQYKEKLNSRPNEQMQINRDRHENKLDTG